MPRPTINDVATRGGRVQGRGLLRAERPARARAGDPPADPRRRRASSAGRPARGPGRCRSPGRSPSAWWSPGRPRSSAPTRSSPPSSPASRPCSPSAGTRCCCRSPSRTTPRRYRRLAQEGRVDGVFVTDLRVDDPRPALLEELGLPAVVDRPGRVDGARPRRSASTTPRASRAAVAAPRRPRPHRASPTSPARSRWCTAAPAARRGAGRCARPACPRASASRPTSPRSPAPPRPGSCSTSPSRRPRSSTPTT